MSDNLTKEQKIELGVLNCSKLSSKGRKGELDKNVMKELWRGDDFRLTINKRNSIENG